MNILTKARVWLARFRNKKQYTFNHTAHKELWDWLANNPGQPKSAWPGWSYYPDIKEEYNECFACEYVIRYMKAPLYFVPCADHCPLVWPNPGTCFDPHREGLYARWHKRTVMAQCLRAEPGGCPETIAAFYSTVSDLARQIRDLPVKEGVTCC